MAKDTVQLDVEFDDEPIIVAVIGDPGKMVKTEEVIDEKEPGLI